MPDLTTLHWWQSWTTICCWCDQISLGQPPIIRWTSPFKRSHLVLGSCQELIQQGCWEKGWRPKHGPSVKIQQQDNRAVYTDFWVLHVLDLLSSFSVLEIYGIKSFHCDEVGMTLVMNYNDAPFHILCRFIPFQLDDVILIISLSFLLPNLPFGDSCQWSVWLNKTFL